MRDFSLNAYRSYLSAMAGNGLPFMLYKDFMSLETKPEKFCLIRHDVDRQPTNALQMARLEAEMNIVATYYFRIKPHTFNREIIASIADLGHEIGYHYESLSDARGNIDLALADFRCNLELLRQVTDVTTCSMHGRPLLPYDNRDMWRGTENHSRLKDEFGLLGEVYLDVDYTDIAYINDTGRNWTSGESNRRDKVDSEISADFRNHEELLRYLRDGIHNKVVFQIHPERWSDNMLEWRIQWTKDMAINFIKSVIR